MPFRCPSALALAVLLLSGCTTGKSETDAGEVQYAAQTAPRPKVEQKVEGQRPPRPKPQPLPQQRPDPRRPFVPDPRGSGDAIPVSAPWAEPGAAIGGLVGAVWADRDNDGYADGYVVNGQYYGGVPPGYDPTLRRVATGGAALGTVAGAVIPGVSALEGAVIGAAVGGLNGAIWADRDNDGRVDGYVYDGQYYAGVPSAATITPAPMPDYSGERG